MEFWITGYLIGMGVTAWMLAGYGWLPGTSRTWKIIVPTLLVICWPVFWFALLLSGIDSIGSHR